MAKLFSSQDVKLLLEQHSRRLNSLKAASSVSEQYLSQIKTTSDNLAMQEVMKILRGVPVDELTKQKTGLKIKPLLDNGYRTVADIYSSTPYRLASIRGISQDAAYTIIRIAKDFANKTFKEIHIKLSTDNKTKQATELVKNIHAYNLARPIVSSCNRYINEYEEQIDDLCKLVKPGKNALRWLFTSKATKERANFAYQKLTELWQGEYGSQTKALVNDLKSIGNASHQRHGQILRRNRPLIFPCSKMSIRVYSEHLTRSMACPRSWRRKFRINASFRMVCSVL